MVFPESSMPRNRQPPLRQLPLNNLPPSHTNLPINRRDPPSKDLHIRQLRELFLLGERFRKLGWFRRRGEVRKEGFDGRRGRERGVGDGQTGEVRDTFEGLWI